MFSAQGFSKKTGQMSHAGEMCVSALPLRTSSRQLTLLPADTLASLSVLPGSARAREMTATSGRSLSRSLPLKGPLGACLKTLLGTSRWASTMCFLTWRPLDTPHGACLFQLVPSTPRIDADGFGFWPTPLATNYKGGRLKPRQGVTEKQTLTNDWQDFCSLVIGHRYPSPELTEAVMGFPTGHTEIRP